MARVSERVTVQCSWSMAQCFGSILHYCALSTHNTEGYRLILHYSRQMEQTCDDIDEMFSNLLGEMDMLTQSLGVETLPPPSPKVSNNEFSFTVGFKDLNESLSALEDKDLDALMADLVADINDVEQRTLQAQKTSSGNQQSTVTQPSRDLDGDTYSKSSPYVTITGHFGDDLPPPPPAPDLELPPPPPPPPPEPLTQEEREAQAKADKIKLALEKLKEAKVKKLVVKVHMYDNSTKSLMVDERQVTRDVLDNLFEKTHCDCNVDWCLYEMYPELQIERFFEDHENVVEVLSYWTRDTENKILFLEKSEKYALFKNPQNFYLANKGKNESKEMNDKNKEALLEESFCGTSVIVPELEGFLYLKEDGKKSWKRRYFLLRASGIYYVPKGKTKTSRDLACFIQFENMNVYYGSQHKVKYKAPTDHCFVLKHPQIQKESQYIKYLCCDDQATLHQWVTGIRIAKYGRTLYDNYKCAVKKAGLSSHWTNQGTVEPAAPAGSLSAGAVQSNGQIPQIVRRSSAEFPETQKKVDASEAKSNNGSVPGLAQAVGRPQKFQSRRNSLQPPPPPERRSSAISVSPILPSKVKRDSGIFLTDPDSFPAPPPTLKIDFPPPPPSDFCEPPPDFVPPPPPASSSGNGDLPLPPPPPPPPVSSKPSPPTKKPVPLPSKRLENTGQAGEPRAAGPPPTGGGGRQADFMSDLMKALEKKRGSTS
ncbi:PREDICTED: amyloid beta A4 precursor protein-binding family B member 1-interacting protein isoform X2 [Calidris pugnax]|uniref:amyloid beta A4 precursor protein-binding family B member 1-interacting protein isoform X2 n=1 Tax=Calidris pugnax TaxID=198806 RepID=UPI00071E184D|nr:PREDICTED: amyloid beta A4 precursor protein-binding family B member 1-interacting protein isoform X2 [Calidris pugnax]